MINRQLIEYKKVGNIEKKEINFDTKSSLKLLE